MRARGQAYQTCTFMTCGIPSHLIAMMAGGDLYGLKDILGHKSIAISQRYAHLSPEFKRAAVNRMDNIWKVAAKPALGAAETSATVLRSQSGHQQSPLAP